MNLKNECCSTVFLKITNKAEIAFIKSFVNSNNKASGLNSTLHRMFFFLKNRTGRLADFFNLFFITIVFH